MKTVGKTKLLLDVAANLSNLADSIWAVAGVMAGNEPVEEVQPERPAPAKEERTAAKAVALEQVRAVLADKSQQGFTADVRALLERYGAPKLSQIDPANYAALLADAEGLK